MASASPQQQFFDERFQDKRSQLTLFAELSESHLYTALFDDSSKEYVALNTYQLESPFSWSSAQRKFEKIFLTELFQNSKKQQICISSSLYTLVPQALFEEKEIENYLSFNHPIEDSDALKFHYSKLESHGAVIVYAIPRGLEFLLKAKLPPYQLYHFGVPLLESIGLRNPAKRELFVHVQEERLDIIYMPEGKLTFFNSFHYQSTEDFIYFLLYVMEQLELDRETTHLQLMGEIEEKSSIYDLLYTYIRSVNLVKRSADTRLSAVLAEVPTQYYFPLFNQHLCG